MAALLADRVLNRPLLLDPSKAAVILDVLAGRIGVAGPDLSALPAEASRFRGSSRGADGAARPYNTAGGVAIISIVGSLVNRGAWIGAHSGLVSYESIAAQLRAAGAAPDVKAIVLDIDSGGGEAGGIAGLAAMVREVGARKKVVAVVNDTACSAAYWIASQAGSVVVSETSMVGSIGVLLLHMNRAEEMKKKAMELDLLEAMRGEVQRALDEGLPFDAFQKNWKSNPNLAEWWGKREMVDPVTGETELVQLGSPRRLRTIYNANIRSARAAGQWERIQRTKRAFPYLEYRTGPSENHRPHHLAKAGTILPVDSPFWDEWFPPNGWGCKCWVRQVTRAEAARRGVSVEPEVADTVVENQRTGEVRIVPQGIDPGWQRNPGQLRLDGMESFLAEKLDELPEAARQAALRDIATSWRVRRIMDGAPGRAPVGQLPAQIAAEAGPDDRMIWVNHDTFGHVVMDHDPKDAEFRKALMSLVANIDGATLAAVEERGDGLKTLRVLIPFNRYFHVAESARPGKAERPTALIVWFDDAMRVRSIMPSTERGFRKRASEQGNKIIDLDKS
ncbi:phage minor head protein [Paracoccus sp. DMF-8]|uniref:phage minor head protein n=1 Tax=Paracoccus sp. DMF-8 TaxID=3019445 RepID=UPI0023E8EA36|nr:phage minor head protein [Paracoccus sp. DMF-8]MDF3606166.1 phage minor head protein [Paracoccus sp. DMF-8]